MFKKVKHHSPKTVFTQNKLEEQGFGWVFNCKEMEVKEVKEW